MLKCWQGKGKWIKVPCITDKYGSCTFKDICPKLLKLHEQQKPCPLPLLTALGLSCTCPIVVKVCLNLKILKV